MPQKHIFIEKKKEVYCKRLCLAAELAIHYYSKFLCFVFLLLNASQVRAYWWLCMSWKRRLIIHVLYMIRVDAVRLWDAVEAQIRVGRVPLPSCWINIRCFQVTLKSSDFLEHTSNNRNDTYCSGLWDNPHRRLVQSNKRVNVSSHCACGWCWCCGVLLPANAS